MPNDLKTIKTSLGVWGRALVLAAILTGVVCPGTTAQNMNVVDSTYVRVHSGTVLKLDRLNSANGGTVELEASSDSTVNFAAGTQSLTGDD